MKRRSCLFILILVFSTMQVFAFNDGFVLGLKVYFSGSMTDPHISKSELALMGADFLKGGMGFTMLGEADLTYIFDAPTYFGTTEINKFGGLGLSFSIGVGQGYTGQVSGMGEAEVIMHVYFTPVITLASTLKTYLAHNRLILGFSIGARVITDPTPTYEAYSNDPTANKALEPGIGTIIISKEMMKKANPVAPFFRGSIEYVQPVLTTTELVLGAYMAYYIYKPRYITMPGGLAKAAKENTGFDAEKTKLKSFYLNSFDFGLTLGFNFKVNP